MELLTEATATHDDDFGEHLNLYRKHTYWGGRKNAGHFAHVYHRKPKPKKKGDNGGPDDSHDTLHGIMAYHGYLHKHAKDGSSTWHKEDEHKVHKITPSLNKKGEVNGLIHQERFKNVSKIDEAKTFGKTLRSIVPKKSTLSTDGTVLDTPAAPSERAAQKKLLGLKDIIKYPDANGNPEGFATAKSPARKGEGPSVGKVEPQKKIKEGIDQFLDEEELDEGKSMRHIIAKGADGEMVDSISANSKRAAMRHMKRLGAPHHEKGTTYHYGKGELQGDITHNKRKDVTHKFQKEEVEQVDELSRDTLSRYARKADMDHRPRKIAKREAGAHLARKKVWGDKKYGIPEPKVKGTD